jgi:lysophospholipase L1-like esterase
LAQTSDTNLVWRDARELMVEGRGWRDTKDFYDRLPARAEKMVRQNVWNLSRDSAGMCVRFVTDATTIAARWTLRRDTLAMTHMPATGVSGLDLYVREQGHWHWLGSGRPTRTPEEKILVGGLKRLRREYALYLPLYNGVQEVKIGVPEGATLEGGNPRPAGEKAIVFYGTSIVQGGCASRPGMAYPAILGRRLDLPTINLGFSGNALSEPEVAQLLAELDPAVYVLDPLPNMTAERVVERYERFIHILRKTHPATPIVMVENIEYADGVFVEARQKRFADANARLAEIHKRLVKAGEKKLFYVSATKLLGNDGEATVDGTHPTDLGFVRMADAMEPALRRALKSNR